MSGPARRLSGRRRSLKQSSCGWCRIFSFVHVLAGPRPRRHFDGNSPRRRGVRRGLPGPGGWWQSFESHAVDTSGGDGRGWRNQRFRAGSHPTPRLGAVGRAGPSEGTWRASPRGPSQLYWTARRATDSSACRSPSRSRPRSIRTRDGAAARPEAADHGRSRWWPAPVTARLFTRAWRRLGRHARFRLKILVAILLLLAPLWTLNFAVAFSVDGSLPSVALLRREKGGGLGRIRAPLGPAPRAITRTSMAW